MLLKFSRYDIEARPRSYALQFVELLTNYVDVRYHIPLTDRYLDVGVLVSGLARLNDPESYAGGSLCSW